MLIPFSLTPPSSLFTSDPVRGAGFSQSSDLKQAQQSFLSVLGKRMPVQEAKSPEESARDTAEQLVSLTLVQPMLKQLRETSTAAPPFAPTQAEKQFRALSDADLAQRIVSAKRFPLVDRLARDLLQRGGRLASGRSVEEELAATPAPGPAPPALELKAKL